MKIFSIFKRKRKEKEEELDTKSYEVPLKNLRDITGLFSVNALGDIETKNIGYTGHYIVFRAIELMSMMISGLDFKVLKGDIEMDPETSLSNGFNIKYPNPNTSFNEIMRLCMVDFFDTGKMFIYFNEYNILEYMPSCNMEFRNGLWSYKSGSKSTYLDNDRLIYLPYIQHGIVGKSPIQILKEDILTDKNASVFNSAIMKNFGQIGQVFESTENTDYEDLREFNNEFKQYHSGASKAGKSIVLPNGVKLANTGKNLTELEFNLSRAEIRDRVLIMFGIHKALLGITDQVNRSVSEEATRQLWTNNLLPLSKRIQEKLNQQLFRKFFPQFRFKYDYSNIQCLQENFDNKLTSAQKLMSLGYTMNEVNTRLGLEMEEISEPIANTRLFQSSLITADDITSPMLPIGEKSASEDKLDMIVKTLDNIKTKSSNTRRTSIKFNRAIGKYERVMKKTLKNYFSKQYLTIIKQVKKNEGSKAYSEATLIDIRGILEKEKDRLAKLVTPIYEQMNLAGDKFGADVIGVIVDSAVDKAIVSDMVNKVKGINDTTYDLMKNIFKKALNEGKPRDQLAKDIKKLYGFSTSRSKIIAQTETSNMFNRSAMKRYKQEGVTKYEWISTNDDKTRESHKAVDGQIINEGETFSNGLKFPGDPDGPPEEVIGCRCTITPVID